MGIVVETKTQPLIETQTANGNLIFWRIDLENDGFACPLAKFGQQAAAIVAAAQRRIDGQMFDIDLLATRLPEDETEQQAVLIKDLAVIARIPHLLGLML